MLGCAPVRQPVQYRLASPSTGKSQRTVDQPANGRRLRRTPAICGPFCGDGGNHGALRRALKSAVAKRQTVACASRLGTLLLAIACWLVCVAALRHGPGCWINARSAPSAAGLISGCSVIVWSAGRDYPATRLVPQAHAANVLKRPAAVVRIVVMKNRAAGILTLSRLAAMRRCGGAWRCWC